MQFFNHLKGKVKCNINLFGFMHLLLFVFASFTANAQSFKGGSISGQVIDLEGKLVDHASVHIEELTKRFKQDIEIDSTGNFIISGLSSGSYKLKASADGFVSVTETVRLNDAKKESIVLVLRPKITEDVTIVNSHITGTSETMERIPGAISIINDKVLEASRVFNFSEALRKTSGINVRDEEGFGLRPNIGIRGLNPTRSTKVLLLEDGIPFTYAPYGDNASYYHPPIERFQSIEVLKGSGQIIYGPVTVGGVINYVTPNPPTKSSGTITLTGGNRNYLNGHIGYGNTWGRTGVIFDYMRKQGDGSRDNTRSGLNDFTFKSLTTLNSEQVLMLKANYYSEDSNVTYSGLTESEYAVNPRQNPFRNDFFYGKRFGAAATYSNAINNNLIFTTNLYGSVFQRHWWRQSSTSSQRPNDSADSGCGGMNNLDTDCGNEGRLRTYYTWGIDPRFRLTNSLFGIRNEMDFGVRIHFETQERLQKNGNTPTARDGLLVENNQRRNQAYSAFVQNRFIKGNWSITPGVRIERINYERTNRLAKSTVGIGLGITGTTNVTQVIPGIGISYRAPGNTTIFAGVHRGFAPPRTEDIINNITGGSIDLDPELSWNYEIGLRSMPTSGINIDATYFRMDYKNQIIPASLAGGVGAVLTNGGKTLHQGLEFGARVDTGSIFKSSHNLYMKMNYTFVPTAEFLGTRFSNISGFNNVLITGNRLPYAPKHMLNTTVGYAHPKGLDIQVEAVTISDQFSDDLNTVKSSLDGQRGLIPSYTIWNATLNYKIEVLRSTIFVTVKNLLDDTFIVDRSRGILPSSPRLVQGGLNFRF